MSSLINYKIKEGDTLEGIALEFNTSVQTLKIMNNLIGDILSQGQIIKVNGHEFNKWTESF